MSKVIYTQIITAEGFFLSKPIGVELPTQLVMRLSVSADGNVQIHTSQKGVDMALLRSAETGSYAYISNTILETLEFDENFFCVVHPISTPDAKSIKPTIKLSLTGGAK